MSQIYSLKWGKTGPMVGYFWDSIPLYPVAYNSKKGKLGTHILTIANENILFQQEKCNRIFKFRNNLPLR